MDFPTAWRIARSVPPEQHPHPKCSFRQTNGGLLCDCEVLFGHPDYIADYGPEAYERSRVTPPPPLGWVSDETWCEVHHADEPGDGYIRCGECGHLYLTGRELVKASKAGYREARVALRKKLAAREQPDPEVLLDELPPEMLLTSDQVSLLYGKLGDVRRSWPRRIWIAVKDWWHVATLTPARVWVCPECAHDL